MENKPSVQLSAHLVKDEAGNWYYPATQRNDGTWRKPLRVKGEGENVEQNQKYIIRQRRGESIEVDHSGLIENKNKSDSGSAAAEMNKSKAETPGRGAGAQGNIITQAAEAEPKKMISLPEINNFLAHLLPGMPAKEEERSLERPKEIEPTREGNNVKASDMLLTPKNEMGPKKQNPRVDEVDCCSSKSVVQKTLFDPSTHITAEDSDETVLQKMILKLEQLDPSERADAWNRMVAKRLYEKYLQEEYHRECK